MRLSIIDQSFTPPPEQTPPKVNFVIESLMKKKTKKARSVVKKYCKSYRKRNF